MSVVVMHWWDAQQAFMPSAGLIYNPTQCNQFGTGKGILLVSQNRGDPEAFPVCVGQMQSRGTYFPDLNNFPDNFR